MLFNSFAFFVFFFIVLTGLVILRNRNYQHFFLLLMSCYFYWYSSGSMLVLLFISILTDYNLGRIIYNSKNHKERRFFLILSLIVNLGMLFIFKYTNFFIESFNYLSSALNLQFTLPILNIILPIGISFYTFCSLSYIIDIYRKEFQPCESLLQYALFITFFPHLVAGPILRAAKFLPQLKEKIVLTKENFKIGSTLIAWGLIKKVIFADNIAVFVNGYFNNITIYSSSIPVLLGALAFGIQIYCDFSGYSGIAIGLAKIMGIELPINFNKPFMATSITDFWRRWHISLSTWLRDYLYIPLGGNRKGKIRTYANQMITMILGGLWHGAAWNFLLWGFYQGLLLSINKIFDNFKIDNFFNFLSKYKMILSLIITQYFVFLGWLIFRMSNADNLLFSIVKYLTFDFSNGLTEFISIWNIYSVPLAFLTVFIIFHIFTFFKNDIIEKIIKEDLVYWIIFLIATGLALFFFAPSQSLQFIYFQF
ncbi:MAG: MBOAT family protein [Candidatus Nanoarchaeia archaeon]|nr:MBOAT family protein [Candidatus Nanoarchaeia archaeon]